MNWTTPIYLNPFLHRHILESSQSPELGRPMHGVMTELDSRHPLVVSISADNSPSSVSLGNSDVNGTASHQGGSSQCATAPIRAHASGISASAPLSPLKLRRTTSTGQTSATKVAADPLLHTAHGTVYTRGRPPWYNAAGELREPFLIGRF